MKITNVSLCAAPAAAAKNQYNLTPELLAAVGARYSRDNEGLDSILSRVKSMDPDKAVDSIFRLLDYGHASVADLVPVALFIDDIPIFDAYYLWSICPQAGGQESSTRYIKISPDSLADAELLGIKNVEEWQKYMTEAFEAYEKALSFWETVATLNPSITRIPKSLLEDKSDKAQKQVARMKRNYAFDRARVFLPVAAKTNVMMIQSARAWVQAIQNLLSHPLNSLNKLGESLREELALSAPRLIRHARIEPSAQKVLARRFQRNVKNAINQPTPFVEQSAQTFLRVEGYSDSDEELFLEDLEDRTNRYSMVGEYLSLLPVTYGWRSIAMAELRDMNRHRTGTKNCNLVPNGFYAAEDQLPGLDLLNSAKDICDMDNYGSLVYFGRRISQKALELLRDGDPSYIYYTLLGTQYPFAHTTTADKYIYTMELRTGVGAHYRYADHCRESLAEWYKLFPSHEGVIFEGSAEPE